MHLPSSLIKALANSLRVETVQEKNKSSDFFGMRPFEMIDNAFIKIDDYTVAQELSDQIEVEKLHQVFDNAARRYCPAIRHFPQGYHWSIMQAEYATDIIFKHRTDLTPIYEDLVRTCVHAVKADHVAMFLGRKLSGRFDGELGTRFHTRIQGNSINHYMDKTKIKMYDKFGHILRLETVSNDITFF